MRSMLNFQAVEVDWTVTQGSQSFDLSRKCAVAYLEDITVERLDLLISERKAASLVLVLPEKVANVEESKKVEKYLLSQKFDLPIYFTSEKSNLITSLTVTTPFSAEPVAAPEPSSNYFAKLQAEDDDATFLIVARYDSNSFRSVDQTGVAALLAVARSLKRGSVLLMKGRGNEKHWLSNTDPRVLESIQFVLVLDSFAGKELYLHGKTPKTSAAIKLYETIEAAAKQMSIKLSIIPDEDSKEESLHAPFSRRKILSMTLSSSKNPQRDIFASSLFNSQVYSPVNVDILVQNVHFLINALSNFVYNTEAEVTMPSPSRSFLSAWSTMEPPVDKALASYSQLVTSFPSEVTHFSHSKVTITAYKMQPVTVDLFLSMGIAIYLIFVVIAVKQPTSWKQLLKIFGVA